MLISHQQYYAPKQLHFLHKGVPIPSIQTDHQICVLQDIIYNKDDYTNWFLQV